MTWKPLSATSMTLSSHAMFFPSLVFIGDLCSSYSWVLVLDQVNHYITQTVLYAWKVTRCNTQNLWFSTDSRTIVLTAQDFAALTRQVKNHSSGTIKNPPTVRVQTLTPKQSQPQVQAPAKMQAASKPTTSSVTVPVQQPVVNSTVPILKKPVTATVSSMSTTPVVTAAPPAVKCVTQPIPVRQELEVSFVFGICIYYHISHILVWFVVWCSDSIALNDKTIS